MNTDSAATVSSTAPMPCTARVPTPSRDQQARDLHCRRGGLHLRGGVDERRKPILAAIGVL